LCDADSLTDVRLLMAEHLTWLAERLRETHPDLHQLLLEMQEQCAVPGAGGAAAALVQAGSLDLPSLRQFTARLRSIMAPLQPIATHAAAEGEEADEDEGEFDGQGEGEDEAGGGDGEDAGEEQEPEADEEEGED
jgi:hypothetical protein